MSSALFIAAEQQIPDLETFVNGKAAARLSDDLDGLATQLGVRPLSSFISIPPQTIVGFLESEGVDTGDQELPPAAWFDAGEGLATVRTLREHIEAHFSAIGSRDAVASDLREYEPVLSSLAQRNVRWHLEVDF
jgi:hypothetical protein